MEKTLAEMTVEEKTALVSGTNFMYTNPVPRLGIPSLRMSDGPHGLRVQKEAGDNGVTGSEQPKLPCHLILKKLMLCIEVRNWTA